MMLEIWTLVFWVMLPSPRLAPIDCPPGVICLNQSNTIQTSPSRFERNEITFYIEDACLASMEQLAEEDIAAKDTPMFCIETRSGRVVRYTKPD